MVDPIADLAEAASQFTDVALSDPLSAILLAFGGLFLGISSLAVAYLGLGAVVDLVTPDVSREPPLRAR
jgi:hypothetical protein